MTGLPADHPSRRFRSSAYIRAARNQPAGHTPVWFQRQAGRSLPEYRAVRTEGSILDTILDPKLSAEITMQPVRRYGVDAAILFSDIVVPIAAVGFGMDVVPGVGPVVEQPFSRREDLSRLRQLEPEVDTPHVIETVKLLVDQLDVPLIGFAGAPFTLASYLIEGQPSRTYAHTKALMLGDEQLWHDLMERLSDLAIASLRSQIHAGASAVQLFDSWAGSLDRATYEHYVAPHTTRVIAEIADLDVPKALFGVGTGELLQPMAATGVDLLGVDWRIPIDVARARIGANIAIQGNLDPAILGAPWSAVEAATRDILKRNAGRPGHVFNLGHGVLPETDPDVLQRIVELVHAETSS
ncbi:MAG: uroporphyrinogen decarboxylase [Acidimicrobiales bacterium]